MDGSRMVTLRWDGMDRQRSTYWWAKLHGMEWIFSGVLVGYTTMPRLKDEHH
jgi:hypothetical protein